MTIYKVTLINHEKGFNRVIEVLDNQYILDVAGAQGIDLPVLCRIGACSTCTGRLVSGSID